jgi:tRNA(fMet)-specific endonuclease VapC
MIPFPVLAEIELGARKGNRREENLKTLKQFIETFDAKILWADWDTVRIYADLRVYVSQKGTPIPENDLWIAALCVQNAVKLYTRDAHFDQLPQVMRV